MTNWVWIDEKLALMVHEQSLVRHGGARGVRDEGLLRSALARAQQLAAYGEDADVVALATAYTAGIVQNHPFVDGNKRTGFVVGILFLELNGARFTASEEDATQAVLGLASGASDEDAYREFLRTNVKFDYQPKNDTTVKRSFVSQAYIVTNQAKCLYHPDSNAAISIIPPYGTLVDVLQDQGEWVLIRFCGKDGWSPRDNLAESLLPCKEAAEVGVVPHPNHNFHSSSNVEFGPRGGRFVRTPSGFRRYL